MSKANLKTLIWIWLLLSVSFLGVADVKTSTPSNVKRAGTTGILQANQTAVYVDPPDVNGSAIGVNNSFTISVKIANVTKLYGVGLQFRWGYTILQYVSHSVRIPKNTYSDGVLWNPTLQVESIVDEGNGSYGLAYVCMSPAPTFNGSGTIFNMTFKILKEGECDLYFVFVDLTEGPAPQPIPCEVIDGLFSWSGKGRIPEVEPFSMKPSWENNVFVNVTTTFNASESFDPDGLPLTLYMWQFGDGAKENSTIPYINHTYAQKTGGPGEPPNPEVALSVVDAESSQSETIYIEVRVVDPVPIVAFDVDWPTPLPLVPRTTVLVKNNKAYFNASESFHPKYPDYIVRYEWDFGDGTNATEYQPCANHTYTEAGETYIVKLRVYDNHDVSSLLAQEQDQFYNVITAETRDIKMEDVTVSQDVVKAGQNVTVNATVSSLVTIASSSLLYYYEPFTAKAFYNATPVDPTDPLNVTATSWTEITGSDDMCHFNQSSKIVSWKWNTTGLGEGVYWIKANVTEAPYETNTTNNYVLGAEPMEVTPEDVHDVAVTELKTMIMQGTKTFNTPAIINVTIGGGKVISENVTVRVNVTARGNVPETFNLTLHIYAPNGTLMQTTMWTNQTQPGETRSFIHMFVTEGLGTGNYTAFANATIVELDRDLSNNNASKTFGVIRPLTLAIAPLPATIRVGDTIFFDATPSQHPDGTITKHTWNFTGDQGIDKPKIEFSEIGQTVNHTFLTGQNGSWQVLLYVEDNYGIKYNPSREAARVTYGKITMFSVGLNIAPDVNFTWTPEQPRINETVTFTSTSTDSGNITRYYWTFGDDTEANATVHYINHSYASPIQFNVTLTAQDNMGENASLTKTITVQKLLSNITLTISPTAMQYGQNVTISGTATPIKGGLNITIRWNSTVITTRLTNSQGVFTYSWKPHKAGIYQITAAWAGDADYEPAQSEIKALTVQKLTMALTLDASPATVKVGEDVTINGTLTPLIIGANANVTIKINGTLLAIVPTDSSGKYTYVWTPNATGTFEIGAEWPGNDNSLADSATKIVTVEAQPTDMLTYAIIAVVVIIVVVAIAVYFLKFRKKQA